MCLRPTPLILRLLLCAAASWPAGTLRADIQHVIAISVDGLRGDYLQTFVDSSPTNFPNLIRLRNAGAFTYNARCDYSYSETVPNHCAMVTGRPVLQPGGFPTSAFTGFSNNFPTTTDTIHVYAAASGTNSGPYKASIFDVVHDRGLSTALYLGKTRLEILRRSFNATNGAPDVIGTDNGRNKIDFAQVQDGSTTTLINTLVAHIAGTLERFTFIHITDPDAAGHASGWSATVNSPYYNSIKTLDGYIGSILNALEANPARAGKVAVLLTADHGGTGSSHIDETLPGNYTIPFFLTAPGVAAGSDLYALFENRFNPGTARLTFVAPQQPIHNADIANLSAALLGLPTVPNAPLIAEFKKPLNIARTGDIITVSWPVYLTGYTLESTADLSAPAWTPITSGIAETAGLKTYSFASPSSGKGFFRLRNFAGSVSSSLAAASNSTAASGRATNLAPRKAAKARTSRNTAPRK